MAWSIAILKYLKVFKIRILRDNSRKCIMNMSEFPFGLPEGIWGGGGLTGSNMWGGASMLFTKALFQFVLFVLFVFLVRVKCLEVLICNCFQNVHQFVEWKKKPPLPSPSLYEIKPKLHVVNLSFPMFKTPSKHSIIVTLYKGQSVLYILFALQFPVRDMT